MNLLKLQGFIKAPLSLMKCLNLILLFFCVNLALAEKVHSVTSGDTLNKIATIYGTSTSALQKYNNIKNVNLLRVGQQIKIPCATASSSPRVDNKGRRSSQTHTVRSGETFFRIAKNYGIDTYDLSVVNPLVEPDKIFVGQRLKIPGSSSRSSSGSSSRANEAQRKKFYADSEKSDLQRLAEQTPAALTSPYTKVIVTKQISLADFAKRYKMTTNQVNDVNGWNYPRNTIFDIGSEAYVIRP